MLFLYTMECCSVMVVVGGLVAKLCPTLSTMDCSLPGFSIHGISQARTLEWVTISFSRGSSWPRDQTCISCNAGRLFTAEQPGKLNFKRDSVQKKKKIQANIISFYLKSL